MAGGGDWVSWETAKALSQRGHKVHVVTSQIENAARHEIINGIEIFRPFSRGDVSSIGGLLKRVFFSPRLWFFLRQFLKQHPVDVIWNYAYSPTIVTTRLAAKNHIPVITAVHSLVGRTWFHLTNPILATYNYLNEIFALRFGKHDAVLCPSSEVARKVRHYTQARVFTIPNPLDLDEIKQAKENTDTESIRQSLGMRKKEQFLLFVGALIGVKNIDGLIRALAKSDAEFKLVLVGDGREKQRIEALIRKVGLGGRVILLGQKSHQETLRIMKSCDILILPSKAESFGIVAIEALALGRPVIATAVGVIPEVQSANLHVINSLEEISQLLEKGIQPKEDDRVLQDYSMHNIIVEFENMLEAAVRPHKPSTG